jgi:hypothetical protein
MTWEYKLIRPNEHSLNFIQRNNCNCTAEQKRSPDHVHEKYLTKNFNDLGAEGWELVSVDNGSAYFKRQLAEEVDS